MGPTLISNTMHWAWKVSFSAAVVWLMRWLLPTLHDLGSDRYAGLNTDVIEIGLVPLGLWLIVRWVALGYLK